RRSSDLARARSQLIGRRVNNADSLHDLMSSALSCSAARARCASLRRVDVWKEVVVAAAAFAAGLINSIAGGGTLVSFPALVWTGRDPVLANATSTVALWPASLAGAYGFRREQKGGARLFLLFAAPSLLGGALGAVLLLRTPSATFARLVPFLILFATL